MIDVYNACHDIYSNVMVYGEPWTGGTSKLGGGVDPEKLNEQQTVQGSLAQSYFAGKNVDCTPEGVFKNGKSICSGYARLFMDIALYLKLNVLCVHCYAKGVGYEPGQKMTSTNHEYNVINLDNKWYHIDSTWGAGHIEGKKFIKS